MTINIYNHENCTFARSCTRTCVHPRAQACREQRVSPSTLTLLDKWPRRQRTTLAATDNEIKYTRIDFLTQREHIRARRQADSHMNATQLGWPWSGNATNTAHCMRKPVQPHKSIKMQFNAPVQGGVEGGAPAAASRRAQASRLYQAWVGRGGWRKHNHNIGNHKCSESKHSGQSRELEKATARQNCFCSIDLTNDYPKSCGVLPSEKAVVSQLESERRRGSVLDGLVSKLRSVEAECDKRITGCSHR
jgi:hypothetical protein